MTYIDISDMSRVFLALVSFGFFCVAAMADVQARGSALMYIAGVIGYVILVIFFGGVAAALAVIAAVGKVPWLWS